MPVILLTDLKSENIAIEAFRRGVRGYYEKPVNIFELKDNIEKLLKIKRNSKEKRAPLEKKLDVASGASGKVTSAIPSNLLRSVSYIEEHLSNPEGICLEKLAKEACFSKYHFCRIFKKTIGMSPMSFVEFMRVQRAKDLLAGNDVRISAVAHYAGFNDFSNFTRKFKKYTGVTPSIYKATMK
jgi:AraC-like DNA-binding protein